MGQVGNVERVSIDYVPRVHQDWLHRNMKRFNVLVCHRRFGKTVLAIHDLLDKGLRCPRKNPQMAYIGPTYGNVKRVAWGYLKEAVRKLPGVTVNESELRVDIPRGNDFVRIMLLGGENPDSLRGLYLDGVVLDEYSEQNPEIWTAVVRPALSDRNGYAIFIFTSKGAGHAYELYRNARRDESGEWFAANFKASETKIIPQKELDAARAAMGPEMYEQEYENSFTAALVGAYYKEELKAMQDSKRITRVPYDKHVPVFTGWDLGIDDSSAIWFFQNVGQEIHAIDYLECVGKGLPWIAKQIIDKPYLYGGHFLPHDAAARELGTGKTRVETLHTLGLKGVEVVKRQKVEDGIHAVRGLLSRMWIDQENCGYGIECLKSYEREYDAKEGVFKLKPKHNWASHGADAMRTYAMGVRGGTKEYNSVDFPTHSEGDYDVLGW
jgi:phage terminase large subunit